MSDYTDDLVRRWEMNDPRDRWKHTGEPRPTTQNDRLAGWKMPEELNRDVDRSLVCEVCGADACAGFGLTLEGVRMGDVGSWRCAEHYPHRKASYTREEWAQMRAADMPAREAAE